MLFIAKIIVLFLILSTFSCSFLNSHAVVITVDSDPIGAKIYIDDVYYGNTVREISLIPDKNYHLKLQKDGYKAVNVEIKTTFSFRKYDLQADYARCRLDFLGSILIFPLFALKSPQCRDFTQKLYSFDLVPETSSSLNNFPMVGKTLPSKPFYYDYQSQPNNQKSNQESSASNLSDNLESYQNSLPKQQVIFNNRSEFINDGNEIDTANQNFGRKYQMDYYNWH